MLIKYHSIKITYPPRLAYFKINDGKVWQIEKFVLSLQNNSRPTLENKDISPFLLKLPSDAMDLDWGNFILII